MPVVKAGAAYFALVFGAGFILGPIRILLLMPRVGQRAAELIEEPIMLVVIVLAARWIVRRFGVPYAASARLRVGLMALALSLIAELGVAGLQGVTIARYIASRDPVAGTVYLVMLGVFAIMPLLVSRTQAS
jgi:hypothetical protein